MPTAYAYMIHCTTGCTCRNCANHYCGPFSSSEVARAVKIKFHEEKRVSSQYAPNGNYTISSWIAEVLPDGRIIVCQRVFKGWADENPGEALETDQFRRGPTRVPCGPDEEI